MATVRKDTISGYQKIDAWENYFNSLNCDLITVDRDGLKLTININNLAEIKFTFRSYGDTDFFVDMAYTLNGSTVTGPSVLAYTTTVIVVYTDTLFFIQVSDYSNRRFCYLYESINDEDYIGYRGANAENQGFYPINSFNLLNVATSTSYVHGARLNYTKQGLNYIDYTSDALFSIGTSTMFFEDPNFIACSTIAADLVITFNGATYYSLSTNTLVEID